MRLLKNLLVNYSIKHVASHNMPIAAITSRNIVKTHFMRHILKNPWVNYSNYRVFTCVCVCMCSCGYNKELIYLKP